MSTLSILEEHLQPCIVYIQCIWQTFLSKAYCYFKGALAVMYLSGTIIIPGGCLQWSSFFEGYCVSLKQALAVISFFKGIESIHHSSCRHQVHDTSGFRHEYKDCSHSFFPRYRHLTVVEAIHNDKCSVYFTKLMVAIHYKGPCLFHRTSCSNVCLKSTVLNVRKRLQPSLSKVSRYQRDF